MGGFAIASAHRGDETKTEQTSFLRTRNTCRGTKGRKKNQRRSLRHGLGSSLVPADIRRLEKIGVLTEEDLLRRKKKLDGHWAPFRLFIWPSKGIFETDPAFREILPPVPRRPLVRCRRNDSMAFLFKIFVLRWTTVGRIFIDETVNR